MPKPKPPVSGVAVGLPPPKSEPPPTKQAKPGKIHGRKQGEDRLGKQHWDAVLTQFQRTGDVDIIHKYTKYHKEDIIHLIEEGIPRLGLPPIQEHVIDQNKGAIELRKARIAQAQAKEQQTQINEQRTFEAITEARAAQDLLSQAVQTGVLTAHYVEQLSKSIANKQSTFDIPEEVTPEVLLTLAKIATANSQTVERAVKLVRLAQGKPTDTVELRIAALLSEVPVEELRDAMQHGRLPAKLASTSAAQPTDANIGKDMRHGAIDVDFEETSTWQDELLGPEDMDKERERTDDNDQEEGAATT